MKAPALLILLLLAVTAHAQERKTYTAPFRTVKGMILLDATINGKPSVLVLDTGTRFTCTTQAVKHERASIGVAGLTFEKQPVLTVNLDSLSKWAGTRIDGLLGQDVLREFARVTIDYKAGLVELEP